MLGVEKPVHYKGKRVDTVRRFSDTLLMFLLKARRPDIHRERFDHTLAGRDGSPLIVRWQSEAEAKS